VLHTAAEGNGPVNALDIALRKALMGHYPEIANFHLADYKVRILDGRDGTHAITRVLIDTRSPTQAMEYRRRQRQHHRSLLAGAGRCSGVRAVGGALRRKLRINRVPAQPGCAPVEMEKS
jgi:hypothetical protein